MTAWFSAGVANKDKSPRLPRRDRLNGGVGGRENRRCLVQRHELRPWRQSVRAARDLSKFSMSLRRSITARSIASMGVSAAPCATVLDRSFCLRTMRHVNSRPTCVRKMVKAQSPRHAVLNDLTNSPAAIRTLPDDTGGFGRPSDPASCWAGLREPGGQSLKAWLSLRAR